MEPLEERLRRGGPEAIRFCEDLIFGDDRITRTLQRLDEGLAAVQIPYAVFGDLACIVHGHVCTTCDIELLLGVSDVSRIQLLDGNGYSFGGAAKTFRDDETGVAIRWIASGTRIGAGGGGALTFPSPRDLAREIDGLIEVDGVIHVGLARLIELKLASFVWGVGLLGDGADVESLIDARDLPASFADGLNSSLRGAYMRLWDGVAESRRLGEI
jgi:hypothetical protein